MTEKTANAWKNIRRIGLFDSGVGGLSVLRSLVSHPDRQGEKQFVYIGDALRCPYGDRPARQISSYVKQITNWLMQQDIEAIVMACNTSAAVSKDDLVSYSPFPVFDLLQPTASYIADKGARKVGVMATNSTVSKKAFSKAIKKIDSSIEVIEIGCPLLVPIVEAGLTDAPEAQEALKPYVKELVGKSVDAIIYGCTHYPFLAPAIDAVVASLTEFRPLMIDPADCLAIALSGRSKENGSEELRIHDNGKMSADAYQSCRFATTGDAESFARIGSRCLKQNISPVESVTVNDLQAASVWRRTAEALLQPPIQLTPEAVS